MYAHVDVCPWNGYPEQQVRHRISLPTGLRIARVTAVERKYALRVLRVDERRLQPTEIDTELHGMFAVDPGEVRNQLPVLRPDQVGRRRSDSQIRIPGDGELRHSRYRRGDALQPELLVIESVRRFDIGVQPVPRHLRRNDEGRAEHVVVRQHVVVARVGLGRKRPRAERRSRQSGRRRRERSSGS